MKDIGSNLVINALRMANINITDSLVGDLFLKDYVVDSGENESGKWEKWASGKLVQTKVVAVTQTETSAFVDYTWTLPIPFVRDIDNVYSGSFECIQQGVDYRYGKLLIRYSNSVTQKIFRGKDEDSYLFNDYKFRLKAEGTWK